MQLNSVDVYYNWLQIYWCKTKRGGKMNVGSLVVWCQRAGWTEGGESTGSESASGRATTDPERPHHLLPTAWLGAGARGEAEAAPLAHQTPGPFQRGGRFSAHRHCVCVSVFFNLVSIRHISRLYAFPIDKNCNIFLCTVAVQCNLYNICICLELHLSVSVFIIGCGLNWKFFKKFNMNYYHAPGSTEKTGFLHLISHRTVLLIYYLYTSILVWSTVTAAGLYLSFGTCLCQHESKTLLLFFFFGVLSDPCLLLIAIFVSV